MAERDPVEELRPDELDALQQIDEDRTGQRGVEDEPPPPWETRDVSIVLPMAEALAMRKRVRQFSLRYGGRFELRPGVFILWDRSNRATGWPIGMVWLQWRTPTEGRTTLFRIEWDPHHGGSEAEVWRALEVLAGRAFHC